MQPSGSAERGLLLPFHLLIASHSETFCVNLFVFILYGLGFYENELCCRYILFSLRPCRLLSKQRSDASHFYLRHIFRSVKPELFGKLRPAKAFLENGA